MCWRWQVGLAVGACCFVLPTIAQELSGTFVAAENPAVELRLQEDQEGAVTGTFSGNGMLMPLQAQRVADGFAGTVESGGERIALAGRINGAELIVQMGNPDDVALVLFRRVGVGAPAAAEDGKTVVNGRELDAADLERIASRYGIRIPEGSFWYDALLGAWGVQGGPTMGFIAPGMDLGAPLPAGASGRGTNIFVNGRELHYYDVLALQQFTGPIVPGRYFIMANGLAGFEGGPPLWNLAALAAPAANAGSNTWQSRVLGASGFSDGSTGAVFLPNGGIVSTGN